MAEPGGQEILQQPQPVENVEKAQKMAIAENLVREWGDRYKKFQEDPNSETDTAASKWFADLQHDRITPDVFVRYADRRADMVGEIHNYEEKLATMNKAQLGFEVVKYTYAATFASLQSGDTRGVQSEGSPVGVMDVAIAEKVGAEGTWNAKRIKYIIDQAYKRNLAHNKSDLALNKLVGKQ